MKNLKIFGIFASITLILEPSSAGLLQSIRDAAFLKDIISESLIPDPRNARDSRALQTNVKNPEPSFFDQTYYNVPPAEQKPVTTPTSAPQPQLQPCFSGDFLCMAQRNMKHTLGSEMSNAIIGSVASLMTELLNTTIARGIEVVAQARNSQDPTKQAEAREAMSSVGSALQTVSAKVIAGFASFLKVSMSGALSELYHTVVNAAAGRSLAASAPPSQVPEEKIRIKLEPRPSYKDIEVTPSNVQLQTNEIRRSSVAKVEEQL